MDFNLKYIKELLEKGVNITEYLRNTENVNFNTSKIIEMAYDLQSGSYIKSCENNELYMKRYAGWAAHIVAQYVESGDNKTILDAGTGEITTFSYFLEALNNKNIKMTPYCFDISWSLIYAGKEWSQKKFSKNYTLNTFCSDMLYIPLHSDSIDVVTTFHALEPNGGRENEILRELLRICKKWLILFEPSYENNSIEGKKRMVELGYIKGLPELIKASEARLVDIIPFDSPFNGLNPTHAYIIELTKSKYEDQSYVHYTIPGSDLILEYHNDSYYSRDEGISYPIISGIPIFRNEAAILSTYKNRVLYD